MLIRVRFKPADNPGKYEGDPFSRRWKPPQEFIEPYKEYRDSDNPALGYEIPPLHFIEDGMVVDSMPPIADRENEHLGSGDRRRHHQAAPDVFARDRKSETRRGSEMHCSRSGKNKMIVIPAYETWVPESERNLERDVGGGIRDRVGLEKL